MKLIQKIYYYFSAYTDPSERAVGRFFAKVNESDNTHETSRKLINLIQENVICINLWTERAYKGYKYLTKPTRSALYQNVRLIEADLQNYIQDTRITNEQIQSELQPLGFRLSGLLDVEKLIYMRQIMGYLSPENNKFVYRASSSFGSLLRDPNKEKLVGDCNQIVTMYIYLYSLKYKVTDLQLILLPGHVAIQLDGIGIEATNGSFYNFESNDKKVLQVQEIVSINLLDTTDESFKTYQVGSQTMLQAAKLAYIVSSNKDLVRANLETAYNNSVIDLVKKNNYKLALQHAKKNSNIDLVYYVGQSAVNYYTAKKDFRNARQYSKYTSSPREADNLLNRNEAIHFYNSKKYEQAASMFSKIGDNDMYKHCYTALFYLEQKKIGTLNTAEDIKNKKSAVRKLSNIAGKSGDRSLIDYANSLQKYF